MSQHDFDRLMHDYYRDQDDDLAPDGLAERIESIPATEPDPSITPHSWRQRLGRWLGRDDSDTRYAGVHGRSRPTNDGRNRLMITTAGTLTAVVALALGVAFVTDVAPTQENAPGAQTEGMVVVPDDWAFFSGELILDGVVPASGTGSRESTENGLTAFSSAIGYADQSFITSDDRLTGKRAELATTILNDDDAAGTELWLHRFTIENENGSWLCAVASVSATEPAEDEVTSMSGWCDGSDAYEGYQAYLTLENPVRATGGSRLGVNGFVSNAARDSLLLPND